ncbi:MAG: HTTM domain-containing protein [Agriterribacter sp.]
MEVNTISQQKSNFFERYFFSKSRYPNIGLIRLLLIALCMLQVFRNYRFLDVFVSIDPVRDALHLPSTLIGLFHLPFPIQKEYLSLFVIAFYTAGFFAMLGIFTRVSVFIFSIMLLYIIDIQAARGVFDHEYTLTGLVLLVMTFIPGTGNFSVDRFISWKRNKAKYSNTSFLEAMIGNPEYVWGYKLILILAACTYFTSGLSKIRWGGLAWLDGQTLTYYLDGSASPFTPGEKPMFISPPNVKEEEKWKDGFGIYSYSYGNRQQSPFWRSTGNALAASPKLMMFIAASVVIFELLGFLLLFEGWSRVIYLIGAIIMHRSIGFLMNLPFLSFQLLCFLLIDWHWVYQHLGKRLQLMIDKLFKRFKLPAN